MNQIQVSKSTIKKINMVDRIKNSTIVTLRFARDENGLSIYCKSPTFETFFKRISEGFEDEWDNKKGYFVDRVNTNNIDPSFSYWGANRLWADGVNNPQLSWMKSVGIRQGITFHFNTLPIIIDDYKKYVETSVSVIENFYNKFIRSKNTTGKIVSKLSGDI